jgi:hypothetical protein
MSKLLFCYKMLKNNKIKKSEIGSKVTIHQRQKTYGLTILPDTEDQIPTSRAQVKKFLIFK